MTDAELYNALEDAAERGDTAEADRLGSICHARATAFAEGGRS
jgi:hypothetical protein